MRFEGENTRHLRGCSQIEQRNMQFRSVQSLCSSVVDLTKWLIKCAIMLVSTVTANNDCTKSNKIDSRVTIGPSDRHECGRMDTLAAEGQQISSFHTFRAIVHRTATDLRVRQQIANISFRLEIWFQLLRGFGNRNWFRCNISSNIDFVAKNYLVVDDDNEDDDGVFSVFSNFLQSNYHTVRVHRVLMHGIFRVRIFGHILTFHEARPREGGGRAKTRLSNIIIDLVSRLVDTVSCSMQFINILPNANWLIWNEWYTHKWRGNPATITASRQKRTKEIGQEREKEKKKLGSTASFRHCNEIVCASFLSVLLLESYAGIGCAYGRLGRMWCILHTYSLCRFLVSFVISRKSNFHCTGDESAWQCRFWPPTIPLQIAHMRTQKMPRTKKRNCAWEKCLSFARKKCVSQTRSQPICWPFLCVTRHFFISMQRSITKSRERKRILSFFRRRPSLWLS